MTRKVNIRRQFYIINPPATFGYAFIYNKRKYRDTEGRRSTASLLALTNENITTRSNQHSRIHLKIEINGRSAIDVPKLNNSECASTFQSYLKQSRGETEMRINIQSHWSAINRFATLGDQRVAIYPAEWAMNIHILARIHPGCDSRTVDRRSSRTEVEGRNESRWWIYATGTYTRFSDYQSRTTRMSSKENHRLQSGHFLRAPSRVVFFLLVARELFILQLPSYPGRSRIAAWKTAETRQTVWYRSMMSVPRSIEA